MFNDSGRGFRTVWCEPLGAPVHRAVRDNVHRISNTCQAMHGIWHVNIELFFHVGDAVAFLPR